MFSRRPEYPIHQDTPRYDPWFKLLLTIIIGLTLIPGIVLLFTDPPDAGIMLAVTAFDALLFYSIVPRRYQIFADRVRIVLGGPFAINLRLATIREARPASGIQAFVYWGLRMAPSPKGVVEIVRRQGLDVVISPKDPNSFLDQLNQALRAMSENKQ